MSQAISGSMDLKFRRAEMFTFVRLIESVPQFEHVQVLSITRAVESVGDGVEPAEDAGDSAEIELLVEASLVIRRIELDTNSSQLFFGEELAAATVSE